MKQCLKTSVTVSSLGYVPTSSIYSNYHFDIVPYNTSNKIFSTFILQSSKFDIYVHYCTSFSPL